MYSECVLKTPKSWLPRELTGEVRVRPAIKFDHLMAAMTLRDALADLERLQAERFAIGGSVGENLALDRREGGIVGDPAQIFAPPRMDL